jgi:ribonuclease P protein component
LPGGCEVANEFRFRPQHRLLQAAQYTGIFGQRRVLRGSLFDLHYGYEASGTAQAGAERSGPRLGLVIPKRNAALSVTRNHCKRVARELFRQQRAQLPALDLVLRLARPLKSANGSTASRELLGPLLREDFDKLLKRLPR